MAKSTGKNNVGRCALTGGLGSFIKCHIIPEALTETTWQGQPLTQKGQSGRYIRRWTSWYDPRLVTDEGEKILQSYDDWAIDFLRRHKLIWSSWGPMRVLSLSYHDYNSRLRMGLRTLSTPDASKLRLFFLSILWRAAATTLWEFKHIQVQPADLHRLAKMLKDGNPEPYSYFPVSLIQLCTQTIPFNQAVSRLTKSEPTIGADGQPDFENTRSIDFFRIYFDGLIANLNIDEDENHFVGAKGSFLTDLVQTKILTLPSERSNPVNSINFERGAPVDAEWLKALIESGQ